MERIFKSNEEIIDYINIGRGKRYRKYTLDDIHYGNPTKDEAKLSYGLTDDGRIIHNAGYYCDQDKWVRVCVVNGLAKEFDVNDNIVAWIAYDDTRIDEQEQK